MPYTRRILTLALALSPGVGGKTITRVLVRNDALDRSVSDFLALGEEALVEEYGFTARAAPAWVSASANLLKKAEAEHARLDALGVRLATPADAHYPARVEQLDPDMIFDLLNAPRKGGLREVPPFGRGTERPGLRNCQDILEPFQPHRTPNHAIIA